MKLEIWELKIQRAKNKQYALQNISQEDLFRQVSKIIAIVMETVYQHRDRK